MLLLWVLEMQHDVCAVVSDHVVSGFIVSLKRLEGVEGCKIASPSESMNISMSIGMSIGLSLCYGPAVNNKRHHAKTTAAHNLKAGPVAL